MVVCVDEVVVVGGPGCEVYVVVFEVLFEGFGDLCCAHLVMVCRSWGSAMWVVWSAFLRSVRYSWFGLLG